MVDKKNKRGILTKEQKEKQLLKIAERVKINKAHKVAHLYHKREPNTSFPLKKYYLSLDEYITKYKEVPIVKYPTIVWRPSKGDLIRASQIKDNHSFIDWSIEPYPDILGQYDFGGNITKFEYTIGGL